MAPILCGCDSSASRSSDEPPRLLVWGKKTWDSAAYFYVVFFFFSFLPLQDPPSVINIIPYTVFKVISGSAETRRDISTDWSQRVRLKNKLEADSLHPLADVLYERMHIERSLFQTAPSLSITSAFIYVPSRVVSTYRPSSFCVTTNHRRPLWFW